MEETSPTWWIWTHFSFRLFLNSCIWWKYALANWTPARFSSRLTNDQHDREEVLMTDLITMQVQGPATDRWEAEVSVLIIKFHSIHSHCSFDRHRPRTLIILIYRWAWCGSLGLGWSPLRARRSGNLLDLVGVRYNLDHISDQDRFPFEASGLRTLTRNTPALYCRGLVGW